MAELLVKDAEKWFRREDGEPFKVIDRLSFEAREGCVTVLIGPSGCGKSTLRLCLSKPALAAVENHW